MRRDLDANVVAALLEQEAWVRRLARCLLGGDTDVDDVVQQTYLRALTYPPAPGTRVREWIAQIARNVVRQRWNKAGRAPATDLPSDIAGSTAPAAELVGEIEMQRRIAGIVLALDEPYRTAIVLRYYDSQTPSQMAATLGCPVETVRTRVKRGLARIRSEMDREGMECQDGKPWQAAVLAMLERAPGVGPGAPGRHAEGARARLPARRRWPVGATAAGLLVLGLGSLAYWLAHSAPPESEPRSSTVLEQAVIPTNPAVHDRLPGTNPSGIVADQALIEPAPLLATDGGHRVTGTVVAGETGAPVAHAEVLVMVWEWDTKTHRLASTTADDAGRFEASCDEVVDSQTDAITSEAEWTGGTFVRVTAPGLAPALLRLRGDGGYPTSSWKAGRSFAAGTIPMFAGTRLAGRAVVVASGAPVDDGTVLLCERYGDVAYTKQIARTRADGTWTADERVPPRADSAAPRTLVVISPSRGVADQPLVVGVAQDALVCDSEFPEPGELDVTVTDEAGAPVEGALVVARPIGGWTCGRPLASEQHEPGTLSGGSQCLVFDFIRGLTGSDGHALLPLLPMERIAARPIGEAPLELSGSGDVPTGLNAFEICGGIAGRCHGDSSVQVVHAGERVAITLIARPQVTSISVTGHVTDMSGKPVSGARVVAAVSSGRPAESTTDEAGSYAATLDARFAARQLCRASAPGFAPREIPAHVDPGVRAITVDFALAPCEPIRGQVVDEKGQPVQGVDLYVRASDNPPPAYDMAPVRVGTGVASRGPTDDEGRFEIADATAGAWVLSAHAPKERKLKWTEAIVRGGTQDLVITLVRDPRPPSDVVVTTITASGRRVVPASAVLISLAENGPYVPDPRRDSDEFVFESITPGPWRAWASAPGGDCGFADFELGVDGSGVSIEVVVGPAGAIRIEAASPGEGIADIRRLERDPPFEWLTDDMRQLAWGQTLQRRTDAAGNFEFAGLAPGHYAVRMTRGSDVACGTCVVVGGQTASPPLDLALGGQLRVSYEGLVQGKSVEIRLRRGDGWVDKRILTADDQPWLVSLPNGQFEWQVADDLSQPPFRRGPPRQGSIEVVAGQVQDLTVVSP